MGELSERQYLDVGIRESDNGVEYDYSGDMSYYQEQLLKKRDHKGNAGYGQLYRAYCRRTAGDC